MTRAYPYPAEVAPAMSLWADFQGNAHGRLIHKWKHYFPAYERHFTPFVGRSATIVEIGIGEGGSLQMWKRFFGPHAQIVGIDIAPRCKAFEEDQIAVRIGSQDDPGFLESVIAEFGPPDIVIDDGSHIMQHVTASFAVLYKRLSKNGVYLVEDLHTAYRPEYGGALHGADSFIESAKALIDELNADFTGDELPPTEFTRTTHSICFYSSVVAFERGTYTKKFAPQIGRTVAVVDESYPPGARSDEREGNDLRLEVVTRREEVASLQAELGREREGLQHALGAVAEAEAERQRLNTAIREASEAAAQSREIIERLRNEVADNSRSREALAATLSTLRSDFEAAVQCSAAIQLQSEATQLQSEATRRQVAELQTRFAANQTALNAIVQSKSWQFTKPLRLVGNRVRSLLTAFRQQRLAARNGMPGSHRWTPTSNGAISSGSDSPHQKRDAPRVH